MRQVVPSGWTQTAPTSGSYTVTLTGGQASTGLDFGDHTPPPPIEVTLTAPTDIISENQTATFSVNIQNLGNVIDPGLQYAYTVDWGDGTTTSSSTSNPSFDISHAYAEGGDRLVNITVSDGGSMTPSTQASLTVQDPQIIVSLTNPSASGSVNVGEPDNFGISITDPDTSDSNERYRYKMDWGDGTSTSAGTFDREFTLSHMYVEAGSYNVILTVIDAGGSTAIAPTTAVIQDPSQNISPTTPKLFWPPLDPITYGTPLGDLQLNAQALTTIDGVTYLVPGTYAYNPVAGTVLDVGNHTLDVVFTPRDSTYFSPAMAQNTITVFPDYQFAITSTPDQNVPADSTYTYQITANKSPITHYSLLQGPENMSIDNDGLLTWGDGAFDLGFLPREGGS